MSTKQEVISNFVKGVTDQIKTANEVLDKSEAAAILFDMIVIIMLKEGLEEEEIKELINDRADYVINTFTKLQRHN